MGTGYVRRSTTEIATGEVIEAADFNNEFNDIVSAFTASTGHSHDGTTAEGGNVTKLLGAAITIGDGSADPQPRRSDSRQCGIANALSHQTEKQECDHGGLWVENEDACWSRFGDECRHP